MKEISADWHLKIVLTIIAIALCAIAANPWVKPPPAYAEVSMAEIAMGIEMAEPFTVQVVEISAMAIELGIEMAEPITVKVVN